MLAALSGWPTQPEHEVLPWMPKRTTPDEATLDQLRAAVVAFRDERDWAQFHSPKNLAIAIAVEAAELLELFLWRRETDQLSEDEAEHTAEEMADVLIFLLSLADALDIDLAAEMISKLAKNEGKYPKEVVRGSAKKYTEYES